MTYSVNDSAADTLSITLETLEDAKTNAETNKERESIDNAIEATERARRVVLEREAPTPTQQLIKALTGSEEI